MRQRPRIGSWVEYLVSPKTSAYANAVGKLESGYQNISKVLGIRWNDRRSTFEVLVKGVDREWKNRQIWIPFEEIVEVLDPTRDEDKAKIAAYLLADS